MRLLPAVLAILAISATPASAHTVLIGDDGPTEALYQSFIDAALVPTADTRVILHTTHCPNAYAGGAAWCMDHEHGPVSMWTDADFGYLWAGTYTERDRLTTRLSILHEVGHVFDFSPGPKGYRRAFMRIMRYRHDEIYTWGFAVDTSGYLVWPDEQFAQAYGLCAMFQHYDEARYALRVWRGYEYKPTREQYERVCYVIRNARSRS